MAFDSIESLMAQATVMSNGCWIWNATKIKGGYGIIWTDGRRILAHRLAWELRYGEIPKGNLVCHNCPEGDNPSCCNPDHLFLGTHNDNSKDCVAKGRTAKGAKVAHFGESHHNCKLTELDVEQIRLRYSNGETQTALANEFSVHQSTLSLICRKKTRIGNKHE